MGFTGEEACITTCPVAAAAADVSGTDAAVGTADEGSNLCQEGGSGSTAIPGQVPADTGRPTLENICWAWKAPMGMLRGGGLPLCSSQDVSWALTRS